jgi:hypothetical protein
MMEKESSSIRMRVRVMITSNSSRVDSLEDYTSSSEGIWVLVL